GWQRRHHDDWRARCGSNGRCGGSRGDAGDERGWNSCGARSEKVMRVALLLLVAASVAHPHADARLKPSRDDVANDTITSIPWIRVGHYTLTERPTGGTVILVDGGAVAGVAQRGAAPGTRETDLLHLANAAARIDGVVLSGGSAFVLDAANGAERWLDERGVGSKTSVSHVPIVPSAVLIDLWVGGKPHIRPGAECGRRAAAGATRQPVAQGTIGAGAGATVGKLLGRDHAMKGGI